MEDHHQWHDPLLLTDASREQQSSSHYISSTHQSSKSFVMEKSAGVSWHPDVVESVTPSNYNKSIKPDRSVLGFSLTTPDLVVCTGSPDLPEQNDAGGCFPERFKNEPRDERATSIVCTGSPDLPEQNDAGGCFPERFKNEPRDERATSIVISLDEGIDGFEPVASRDISESLKFSSFWRSSKEADLADTTSFELVLAPTSTDKKVSEEIITILSINAGSEDKEGVLGGMNFQEDTYFIGGEVIGTDADVGDGECLSLYQTARFGNLSYKFPFLEPGKYLIDLHFAEIIFTDGPIGMRVFDIFLQEEKVVSQLDVFSRVGANRPLILPDIEALVEGGEGLSIRLAGVTGNPIISGISVRKDLSTSYMKAELPKVDEMIQLNDLDSSKSNCKSEGMEDYERLQTVYEFQRTELIEARRTIEELRRENQVKQRECQEAWNSLKDLQNELMRKSMHVGSLAFAIEGQVKEKTKWFSCLRDLNRKLKILKLEHIRVSEEAMKYKKCLMEMDEMSSSIQRAMNKQADFTKEIQAKFVEGAKEKKELYNKVLELKGNIRVFCRCRPLNMEEISMGASTVIDFDSAKDGELTVRSNGWPKKTFKFDAVFGPQADQADVFEGTASFATSVLDGYNVCVFAYGQTGTGKTFTMEGTKDARGVNYRTLEELFHIIKEREKLFRYEISVSVLEVYNEQIRDLLATGSQPGTAAKRLEVRQVSEGMHHIPGLVEAHVSNMSEVWDVLQTGSNARAVGSTNANEHSSRSHCIHCVMVKGENLLDGEHTRSKLWLVDLAGSERIAKTEAQGERLKEAQNINRSLSALGDVISALATKSPHVPFRNSKLTHLLQDSLGGDSKALMFVQISPNENDVSETLCSLNFASRVKGIELGPARKQIDNTEFLRYKQLVEKSKQETKIKEVQIKKMEENIHSLEMKIKDRDQKNKNMHEKVKELESQLLIERKLARQHVDTKIAEQQQLQTRQQLEEQILVPNTKPRVAAKANMKNNTCNPDLNSVNLSRPFTDRNIQKFPSCFPPEEITTLLEDPEEKENNPQMIEPLQPKRISLCPTAAARRMPIATTDRRNSLIPLPATPMMTSQLPSPLLPLPTPLQEDKLGDTDEVESNCMLRPTTCSPKILKSGGGRKVNSIFRRSVQKKLKSPLQQQLRRGGLNVGGEKVRVSIGSRGRMAHKVPHGNNSRRIGVREFQQKQSQKDKERGWI